MNPRILLAALAALTLGLSAAPATAQQPLAGTGENMQAIARVPIPHATELEMAGDWAFVAAAQGDDAGGLYIVNIADPTKPFIEGKWLCEGGWGDVDLSPDGNLAVLTNAKDYGGTPACMDVPAAVVLLDISDKKNPKVLSVIEDDADIEYVHTATLDNKWLYLNTQEWAAYPQHAPEPRVWVYDVSDWRNPVRKGVISKQGVGIAHDTFIDHRPDGKSLMYAASVHTTDIFDVTDPLNAEHLQETASPEITISHDVQPNYKRDMIIVDDEGFFGGMLSDDVSACGRFGGPGPANYDSGSVHFYAAAADGTFANGGAVPLGSWNAPVNANEGACVAHVFWQAPDDNRLTQAYYRIGAFVLDFNDPANAQMLASFVPDGGATYWSAKPHNGYLYASNMEGSLDIMRYTGEGGAKWPATAGPAEVQRSARQGVPYVPIAGSGGQGAAPQPAKPDERKLGARSFVLKFRPPGKKGRKTKMSLTFTDSKGVKVGAAKFRRTAKRRGRAKVSVVAEMGTYRWVLKAGRKTLRRGKVRMVRGTALSLSPDARLAVRVRP